MPLNNTSSGNNRGRALARIHIGRKQLGMDDVEYRSMLEGQTGKDSCKNMTLSELFKVEAYLKKLGFKPKQRVSGKRYSPLSRNKEDHQKTMVDKIRALWIDMHREGIVKDGSENALEKWVERMSAIHNKGRGIQKVDWLAQNEHVCYRVLESLKKWQARES